MKVFHKVIYNAEDIRALILKDAKERSGGVVWDKIEYDSVYARECDLTEKQEGYVKPVEE